LLKFVPNWLVYYPSPLASASPNCQMKCVLLIHPRPHRGLPSLRGFLGDSICMAFSLKQFYLRISRWCGNHDALHCVLCSCWITAGGASSRQILRKHLKILNCPASEISCLLVPPLTFLCYNKAERLNAMVLWLLWRPMSHQPNQARASILPRGRHGRYICRRQSLLGDGV
jgi:hypothetical protein